jgi:hypothetical protein
MLLGWVGLWKFNQEKAKILTGKEPVQRFNQPDPYGFEREKPKPPHGVEITQSEAIAGVVFALVVGMALRWMLW